MTPLFHHICAVITKYFIDHKFHFVTSVNCQCVKKCHSEIKIVWKTCLKDKRELLRFAFMATRVKTQAFPD
jgi:hypothetical protein